MRKTGETGKQRENEGKVWGGGGGQNENGVANFVSYCVCRDTVASGSESMFPKKIGPSTLLRGTKKKAAYGHFHPPQVVLGGQSKEEDS